MNNPENFILTTDYATLKNDATGSIVVTMPPKILSALEVYTVSEDINIGVSNASARIRIGSQYGGNKFYAGNLTSLNRFGQSVSPGDSPYSVIGYTQRVATDTLRALITIKNPYGFAIATELHDEVLTFEISTFLPPYP